jgi:DNA-binding Xre family transcriptional regulator
MSEHEKTLEHWFYLNQKFLMLVQQELLRGPHDKSQVARRLGVSLKSLKRLAGGQRRVTLKQLHALARAMDCRVEVSMTRLYDLPTPSKDTGAP